MSARSKFGRATRWAVLNVITAGLCYLGLFAGERWAYNIFAFTTAFQSIISLGVFSRDLRAEVSKAGRSVPAWLSSGVDICVCLACADSGSFWLATAYAWITTSEKVAYSEKKGAAS